ncbi:hypothetical protein NJG16_06555 [Stenotrophomonas maltophilia]|uniref:hypothetical protein n=1 Tax=Stenotrophomonas lactitubi TaxID=2045214 RepID=UPI00203B88D3|nr:hypothetical protein [Stenotrophomonas lactitubi]MCO7469717.1 hypothetical protein [Stenotrophomonas maltophilia]
MQLRYRARVLLGQPTTGQYADSGRGLWTYSHERLTMALQEKSPHPGSSMKTLALIALSLSICISLAGCIAPFRVKAREYASADMTPPEKRDAPVPSAPPQ